MTATTDMRQATVVDIVRRLTEDATQYKMTAGTEQGLGWGLGNAQLGIIDALDEAIDDGLVVVKKVRDTTYGSGVRFVALADGVAFCRTCVDGCEHESRVDGESCGHLGCWGPDATSDCAGVGFARVAYRYGT